MRMPWVITQEVSTWEPRVEKRNTENPRSYAFGRDEAEDAQVRRWIELVKPLCPLGLHSIYVDISDGLGRITDPATHDCRVVTNGWSLSLEDAIRVVEDIKTAKPHKYWFLKMEKGEEVTNAMKIGEALHICAMAMGETYTTAMPKITAASQVSDAVRKALARWASGKGEMPRACVFEFLACVSEAKEREEAHRRYCR